METPNLAGKIDKTNPYRRFAKICANMSAVEIQLKMLRSLSVPLYGLRGLISLRYDMVQADAANIPGSYTNWPEDVKKLHEEKMNEFMSRPLDELMESDFVRSNCDGIYNLFFTSIEMKCQDTMENYKRGYASAQKNLTTIKAQISRFQLKNPAVTQTFSRDLRYFSLRVERMERDLTRNGKDLTSKF